MIIQCKCIETKYLLTVTQYGRIMAFQRTEKKKKRKKKKDQYEKITFYIPQC